MVYAVPVLATIGWILIAVMSALNPSGTLEASVSVGTVATTGIAGGVVAFLLPTFVVGRTRVDRDAHELLSSSRQIRFIATSLGSLLLLIAMAAAAATLIHRDFHSYYAQIILLYGALFLLTFDSVYRVRNKEKAHTLLFFAAALLFGVMIVWLMLMSYAIVVRAEPRWIEATAYNVLNALIALFFLGSAAFFRERRKREVVLEESSIFVDGKEVTSILSGQERRLLAAFVSTPRTSWNCADLRSVLVEPSGPKLERCEECIKNDWSPSKCPHYRNIKNRISDAKKYLELLEVATIVPATGELRRIREAGWRLRLFEDVRVLDRREKKEKAHGGSAVHCGPGNLL